MVDFAPAIWSPSPSYWASRQGFVPKIIVMHGTQGAAPGCVNWLCNPQAGASVHYVVGTDGTVWQLVAEEFAAWGNGIPEPPSPYVGQENPNLYSISLEHVRVDTPAGPNSSPITSAQQAASTALVADIRTRWGPLPLIPHAAISPQSRANCPGPHFPMDAIDKGAPGPPKVGLMLVHFDGTPQRLPVVFYAGPSFERPLYTSAAGKGTPLHFDGWEWGLSVHDPSTNAGDRRWYRRLNPQGRAGLTPSAWILGNAPNSQP